MRIVSKLNWRVTKLFFSYIKYCLYDNIHHPGQMGAGLCKAAQMAHAMPRPCLIGLVTTAVAAAAQSDGGRCCPTCREEALSGVADELAL
jgi:hypothetical protein